jgi:hypothetical protein
VPIFSSRLSKLTVLNRPAPSLTIRDRLSAVKSRFYRPDPSLTIFTKPHLDSLPSRLYFVPSQRSIDRAHASLSTLTVCEPSSPIVIIRDRHYTVKSRFLPSRPVIDFLSGASFRFLTVPTDFFSFKNLRQ